MAYTVSFRGLISIDPLINVGEVILCACLISFDLALDLAVHNFVDEEKLDGVSGVHVSLYEGLKIFVEDLH